MHSSRAPAVHAGQTPTIPRPVPAFRPATAPALLVALAAVMPVMPGGAAAAASAASATPAAEMPQTTACEPSGKGTDYAVGPGKPYTSLDAVPWESLKAGDTVRIFHRVEPYKGKFLIAAQGTPEAPVRICGVKGPNGERPEIDGNGATSRPALARQYGGSTQTSAIHQARSIIVIKQLGRQEWNEYPRHIRIDGLAIRRAHPSYTFTDTAGQAKPYDKFGACLWIERGHHITIADNEFSDCQMAIFTKTTDEAPFAQTRALRISGNHFHGHGIANSFLEHTLYLQGIGITVEGNRLGPLRPGALGNQIKDRSSGLVVRYNRIEEGAHSIDLVDAEDFPQTALADPSYRTTQIYGNVLINGAASRAIVHYGGDHFGGKPGGTSGEAIFRKGTLLFHHNTVIGNGPIRLFRVSTTDESVLAWNNIFWGSAPIQIRENENEGAVVPPWTPNGLIRLGTNWIRSGWGGTGLRVQGLEQLIGSDSTPIDLTTLVPLAGSSVIDAARTPAEAAAAQPVQFQPAPGGGIQPRRPHGTAADLGAIER